MLDFVIFAVTFLTVLLVAIIWLYPSSKRVTTIPGLDPSSKEDGNLTDIARAGSLHEFLLEIHGRFGTITGFWWGQTYVVSIASPQLFKQHSAVFDKPPELFRMFEPVFGPTSLHFANGSEGRSRRQHYDHDIAHENLHKYFEQFQKLADGMEKKWMKIGDHDHIPLSEHMFIFAIKASLLSLLGELVTDEKLVLSIRNAYDKAWNEIETRLTDPVILDEKSPRVAQFNEAVEYLQTTVKKIIKNKGEHEKHKQGHCLLSDIRKFKSDEEAVLSETITYLIGDFPSSAYVLTWGLYFLATHRAVQDKLHKELVSVLGDSGVVNDSNFGQLRYMNQVIDETLRCAVVEPWAARVQDFDSELGGHKIPKNTPVIHALGVVLQDETLWPLPDNFDPDRFSVERSKDRSPYAFVPFGFAGKRKCPGYKIAHLEITVLLATLIRKFHITLWNEQVVQPVHGLVTRPQDEIWVKVSKR